jgi:hypothetical protein
MQTVRQSGSDDGKGHSHGKLTGRQEGAGAEVGSGTRLRLPRRTARPARERLWELCAGGVNRSKVNKYGTTQLKPQGQARVCTGGPPESA